MLSIPFCSGKFVLLLCLMLMGGQRSKVDESVVELCSRQEPYDCERKFWMLCHSSSKHQSLTIIWTSKEENYNVMVYIGRGQLGLTPEAPIHQDAD